MMTASDGYGGVEGRWMPCHIVEVISWSGRDLVSNCEANQVKSVLTQTDQYVLSLVWGEDSDDPLVSHDRITRGRWGSRCDDRPSVTRMRQENACACSNPREDGVQAKRARVGGLRFAGTRFRVTVQASKTKSRREQERLQLNDLFTKLNTHLSRTFVLAWRTPPRLQKNTALLLLRPIKFYTLMYLCRFPSLLIAHSAALDNYEIVSRQILHLSDSYQEDEQIGFIIFCSILMSLSGCL